MTGYRPKSAATLMITGIYGRGYGYKTGLKTNRKVEHNKKCRRKPACNKYFADTFSSKTALNLIFTEKDVEKSGEYLILLP